MKLLIISSFCILSTLCLGMERIDFPPDQHNSADVTSWAKTVVTCIEKRNKEQLSKLLKQPPVLRTQHPLNNNIIEEIKAHRDEQLDALRAPYGGKKVWNKFRAIVIDLGLPIAAFGIGLADGIISEQPVIIALSAIYLVLSAESALKQTYSHWTMKEYEGKVEEFDVWLQVMESMQRIEQKRAENPLQTNDSLE